MRRYSAPVIRTFPAGSTDRICALPTITGAAFEAQQLQLSNPLKSSAVTTRKRGRDSLFGGKLALCPPHADEFMDSPRVE